jgi:hypothetical protein
MIVKRTVLTPAQRVGVFAAARKSGRPGVRILCYHGLARSGSEALLFRPKVYIAAEIFAERMAWLQRNQFNVLSLDEALQRLAADTLPPRAVVITFDEGFENFESLAAPILASHGFPATVYVTTYYVLKRNPVFRLAIQYLLWKSDRIGFVPGEFDHELAHAGVASGQDWRAYAARTIYRHAESKLDT